MVGVQPFGGAGLSGTGPKAGGPLYLARLARARRRQAPLDGLDGADAARRGARLSSTGCAARGHDAEAERCVG